MDNRCVTDKGQKVFPPHQIFRKKISRMKTFQQLEDFVTHLEVFPDNIAVTET